MSLRPLSSVTETLVPVRQENGRPRTDLPVVQETQITDPVQLSNPGFPMIHSER